MEAAFQELLNSLGDQLKVSKYDAIKDSTGCQHSHSMKCRIPIGGLIDLRMQEHY